MRASPTSGLAIVTAAVRVAAVDCDADRSAHDCSDACHLAVFTSGEELLEHSTEHWDVVVVDMWTPGLSGLHICERLHSMEVTKQLPVVLVARDMTVELAIAALAAGAIRILTKPYSLAAIVEIREELEGARSTTRRSWILAHLAWSQRIASRLARRFRPLLDPADAEALAFAALCDVAEQDIHDDVVTESKAARIRALVLAGVRPILDPSRVARLRDVARAQWRLVTMGCEPTCESVASTLSVPTFVVEAALRDMPGVTG